MTSTQEIATIAKLFFFEIFPTMDIPVVNNTICHTLNISKLSKNPFSNVGLVNALTPNGLLVMAIYNHFIILPIVIDNILKQYTDTICLYFILEPKTLANPM